MKVAVEEVKSRIEAEMEDSHYKKASFVQRWGRGELNRAQLGFWAVQQNRAVAEFNKLIGILFYNSPDPETGRYLLENLGEEELEEVPHSEYLLIFAEACGISRGQASAMELLPTTRGLIAWNQILVSRSPFVEAVAGFLVGGEARIPGLYETTLPAMKRYYDFNERDLSNFPLHIVSDDRHGKRAMDIVLQYTYNEEVLEKVLKRIREQGEMWVSYFDGIERHTAQMK